MHSTTFFKTLPVLIFLTACGVTRSEAPLVDYRLEVEGHAVCFTLPGNMGRPQPYSVASDKFSVSDSFFLENGWKELARASRDIGGGSFSVPDGSLRFGVVVKSTENSRKEISDARDLMEYLEGEAGIGGDGRGEPAVTLATVAGRDAVLRERNNMGRPGEEGESLRIISVPLTGNLYLEFIWNQTAWRSDDSTGEWRRVAQEIIEDIESSLTIEKIR